MPPITLAFITDLETIDDDIKTMEAYINANISEGYVLDGLQRLNTLKRAFANSPNIFNKEKIILLNIIIAESEDKLLYRMITLNNGQKPMTPRHQIEILTQELFDFDEFQMSVQTEKERSYNIIRGSFNLGDISRGYLAFFTNSVHIENDKFIGEKMDQILVGKILDTDIAEQKLEFKNVLQIVDRLSADGDIKNWLKTPNNFIGFCVGIKASYKIMESISLDDFRNGIELFELSFKSINPSKVKLGKYRRELVKLFIDKFEEYSLLSENDLSSIFFEETVS